jgi:hypothetical protein
MIESAAALESVDEIAAVDGVDQLFIGPYDLSLTLGTTVPALLDDDSDASPLSRIVQAATAYGRTVGGFAGTPELAERFRERGILCVAVASDCGSRLRVPGQPCVTAVVHRGSGGDPAGTSQLSGLRRRPDQISSRDTCRTGSRPRSRARSR